MIGIDHSVFRSYDIRGTYPDQLDDQFAYLLGRALPGVLSARRVVVGHDARLSSPCLYAAFTAGLADTGAEVGGMGLCVTELVYYVMGSRPDLELGVMITASHNPPEYNGFKVVKAGGEPVPAATGLGEVWKWMEAMSVNLPADCTAPAKTVAAEADYLDFAFELVGVPDVGGLRIVVDAGNGVGGLLWEALADRLGIDPVRMNFEPDGRFPAHAPDPSQRANLEPLVQRVLQERADMGFCYDGDADRVVVVLDDGHVVDGSEMIVCIADPMLDRQASLVFGVGQTTSRKALDHFRRRGAEPVIMPVGHAKIKTLMRSTPEMAFAGEDAGHYYYSDFFCCDSSLVTTLHVLHAASEGGLKALVNSLPGPWHRPRREPAFDFPDRQEALDVCRKVAADALGRFPDAEEITCEKEGRVLRSCRPRDLRDAEGVRVDYADWWFCVRPSGTEPIVRLAVEARSESLLTDRTDSLCSLFGK